MGEVWGLTLPREQKYVLIALADHADHEGNHVYPSVGLVAWKTDYSERQIRRILEELEKVAAIIPTDRQQGLVTEYRIDLSQIPRKEPRSAKRGRPARQNQAPDQNHMPEEAKTEPAKTKTEPVKTPDILTPENKTPDILTENPGHFDTPTPDILTKTPDISDAPYKDARVRLNHQEPLREPSEEKRGSDAHAPNSNFFQSSGSVAADFSRSAAASRTGRLCAALVSPPSLDDVRCWLREIGQSESHAEKFHAYYDERGWTKGRDNRPVEDWRKTLATWLLREPDFQARSSPSPSPGSRPTRAAAPPGQSALGTRAQEKIERLAAIKAGASPSIRLAAPSGQDILLPEQRAREK